MILFSYKKAAAKDRSVARDSEALLFLEKLKSMLTLDKGYSM
jgi:hypothetical protein